MTELVVIGGAGWAGMALIRALNAVGVDYCGISHSDAGAARLYEAQVPRVAQADLAHPTSLAAVLRTARVVYAIPPTLHRREDEYMIGAIRAAEDSGVQRFVYHSVMQPGTPFLRNHQRKARVEAALRESQLKWTILQPSMYAQVVVAMFGASAGDEVKVPFDVDAEVSIVDLADCAAVGVKTVQESGAHDFATYELAGPVTTLRQAISALGRTRGVRLRARRVGVTEGPLPEGLTTDAEAVADLVSTYAHYSSHGFRGNSFVLRSLLGRPPKTFEDFLATQGESATH